VDAGNPVPRKFINPRQEEDERARAIRPSYAPGRGRNESKLFAISHQHISIRIAGKEAPHMLIRSAITKVAGRDTRGVQIFSISQKRIQLERANRLWRSRAASDAGPVRRVEE
jgi:hypothetical protein